jgi:hypothetical protein
VTARKSTGVLVAIVALSVVACSQNQQETDRGASSDGASSGDAGRDSSHITTCQPACADDEVCANGRCEKLPSSCPCPLESYCDLATNRCKKGCVEDAQCSQGKICLTDSRTCVAGCREDKQCGGVGQICDKLACTPGCRADGECGAGNICDNLTCRPGCRQDSTCGAHEICEQTSCRAGCRNDGGCQSGEICEKTTCRAGCRLSASCAMEKRCDATTLTCVAGCEGDARCNTGRICDAGQCRNGCRSDTGCALKSYCDLKKLVCAAGCDARDERCPYGWWCGNFSTYYRCTSQCSPLNPPSSACHPGPGETYTCYNPPGPVPACRQNCSTNAVCAPYNKVCGHFLPSSGSTQVYSFCVSMCTAAGCPSSCTCAADGLCRSSSNAICPYVGLGPDSND